MQFIVTGKAIDAPMAPPSQAIAAYRASFEMFASGKDPRITAVYPHADERAVTLIVDVDSGDELSSFLLGIPAFFLSSFEAHPVAATEHVLRSLTEIEASATPGG
jgi:hypothetical protein